MRIDSPFTSLQPVFDKATNRPVATTANKTEQNMRSEESTSTVGEKTRSLVSGALAEPEMRSDRVQSLRAAILDGTYSVDAQKVASAMFDELF